MTHDTRPAEPHDLSAFAFDLLKQTEARRLAALQAEADALNDYRCPNGCGSHACRGRCSPNHDRPPRWERG